MSALRAQRAQAAAQARALALRVAALEARRATVERTAQGGNARQAMAGLDREIAALNAEAVKSRAALGEFDNRLRDSVLEFSRLPLDETIGALDDHVPFLMFPVRLETKFAHGADGMTLRVRIFPDDINISTHDPLLSEGETEAGGAYWQERARALSLSSGERRAADLGAWTLLATRYGGPRARYIARKTRPAAWPPAEASFGSAPPPPPEEEPVRLTHSVAPPHARLLPDYFVVIGLNHKNEEVARAVGAPIPDTLMLDRTARPPRLNSRVGRMGVSPPIQSSTG